MSHATAVTAELGNKKVKIVSIFDLFDSKKDLFPMHTAGGEDQWAADAVHMTDQGYREVGAHFAKLGGDRPFEKRERLDSLIPGPPPKKVKLPPSRHRSGPPG